MSQGLTDCPGLGALSSTVAMANAQSFCQQAEPIKIYNAGSENEIQFASWDAENHEQGPQDDPHCYTRLVASIINGCSGSPSTNTSPFISLPSTLNASDTRHYDIQPLSKRSVPLPKNTCDLSYRGFFDILEIRGRGFAEARMDPHAWQLKERLLYCGLIVLWSFNWTPDDCCYEWYLQASVPIGVTDCIGDQLVLFGGQKGNCWTKHDPNDGESVPGVGT